MYGVKSVSNSATVLYVPDKKNPSVPFSKSIRDQILCLTSFCIVGRQNQRTQRLKSLTFYGSNLIAFKPAKMLNILKP